MVGLGFDFLADDEGVVLPDFRFCLGGVEGLFSSLIGELGSVLADMMRCSESIVSFIQ